MRTLGNYLQAAILRAVAAEAELDETDRKKPVMVIESIRSVDWASATFVGARHEIDLRLEGDADAVADACARLTNGLPEREIPIQGHIVAEIFVNLVKKDKRNLNLTSCSLTVNALTIVD